MRESEPEHLLWSNLILIRSLEQNLTLCLLYLLALRTDTQTHTSLSVFSCLFHINNIMVDFFFKWGSSRSSSVCVFTWKGPGPGFHPQYCMLRHGGPGPESQHSGGKGRKTRRSKSFWPRPWGQDVWRIICLKQNETCECTPPLLITKPNGSQEKTHRTRIIFSSLGTLHCSWNNTLSACSLQVISRII